MAHELKKDLPLLTPCDGGCGEWLALDEGEVIGQRELGHGLGLYAPVRVCPACTAKRRATRPKAKIETKANGR